MRVYMQVIACEVFPLDEQSSKREIRSPNSCSNADPIFIPDAQFARNILVRDEELSRRTLADALNEHPGGTSNLPALHSAGKAKFDAEAVRSQAWKRHSSFWPSVGYDSAYPLLLVQVGVLGRCLADAAHDPRIRGSDLDNAFCNDLGREAPLVAVVEQEGHFRPPSGMQR